MDFSLTPVINAPNVLINVCHVLVLQFVELALVDMRPTVLEFVS
jgi:hypothetical protein